MNPQNTVTNHPDGSSSARVASVLNLIAGLYLFISPWIYGVGGTTPGSWNSYIFGLIVAILAIVHLSAIRQTWASWINALIGIWVIISPWVYGYYMNLPRMWNSIIVGVIILILGVWAASASPKLAAR